MECEKLPQALRCGYCKAMARKNMFSNNEVVRVIDGFAHIGTVTTIEEASKDWSGIISYKLKGLSGWWPQSSLERV